MLRTGITILEEPQIWHSISTGARARGIKDKNELLPNKWVK